MEYQEEEVRDEVNIYCELIDKRLERIDEEGLDDANPNFLYRLASLYSSLARCRSILREDLESINAFEKAADFFLSGIAASWDVNDASTKRRIPGKVSSAIGCSLIAQNDNLSKQISKQSARLETRDISEFLLESEGTPLGRFKYYTALLDGMLYLGKDQRDAKWGTLREDSPVEELLKSHKTAARNVDEPGYIELSNIAHGIVMDDVQQVEENLDRRLHHHQEMLKSEPGKFHKLVAVTEARFIHLAARRGIDLTVDSEYLPRTVLPDNEIQ